MVKTFTKKLLASFNSAALFMLISHPQTYKLVDSFILDVSGGSNVIFKDGCPTVSGGFLHMIVFFLLSFVSMNLRNKFKNTKDNKNDDTRLSRGLMIKYSFYGALLWFLFSNPQTFKLTSAITNNIIPSSEGCPGNTAIMVHGVGYFLALVGVMYFPKDK